MKKTFFIAMLLSLAGLLFACSSQQEQTSTLAEARHDHIWSDATCQAPKTCSDCGATEGDTAEHHWIDATCTSPKRCTLCGTTDGSALSHRWRDATCTSAKQCTTCNKTEGSPKEHSFAGGKCTYCGKKTDNYDKILKALSDSQRYVEYISIESQILETHVELYKINGKASELLEIEDCLSELSNYYSRIYNYCQPYQELYPLIRECTTATPSLATDSWASILTYAGKYKSLTAVYNAMVDNYNSGTVSSGNSNPGTSNTGNAGNSQLPYLVQLSASTPIYSQPSASSSFVQNVGEFGTYTIVEESFDSNGRLWGKLKSGLGWVLLKD